MTFKYPNQNLSMPLKHKSSSSSVRLKTLTALAVTACCILGWTLFICSRPSETPILSKQSLPGAIVNQPQKLLPAVEEADVPDPPISSPPKGVRARCFDALALSCPAAAPSCLLCK